MDRRRFLKLTSVALAGAVALPAVALPQKTTASAGLWSVWDDSLTLTSPH